MRTKAEKKAKKERKVARDTVRQQQRLEVAEAEPEPSPEELDLLEELEPPTRGKRPRRPKQLAPPPVVVLSETAKITEARIRHFGKTPKYASVEEMIPVIQQFFDYCVESQQPPLITTLALALGFATRKSIDDYLAKPEFHEVLTRAKLVCEDYAARGLITGKNTVGFIFLLKQYGWKDVQEKITTIETHEQRIARLIQNNVGGR